MGLVPVEDNTHIHMNVHDYPAHASVHVFNISEAIRANCFRAETSVS